MNEQPLSQPSQSPPPSQPKRPLLVVCVCLFIVLATFTAYLFMQNQSLKQQLSSLPAPATLPVETSVKEADPTANWKIYTNSVLGFSFKYPETYVLTTPEDNFINIRPSESISERYSDISIDARVSGNYSNFQSAILKAKEGLINLKVDSLSNVEGELISGSIDGGIGGGREVKNAIIKYKNGAISIQYLNSNIGIDVYKQILSTFTFLEQNVAQ